MAKLRCYKNTFAGGWRDFWFQTARHWCTNTNTWLSKPQIQTVGMGVGVGAGGGVGGSGPKQSFIMHAWFTPLPECLATSNGQIEKRSLYFQYFIFNEKSIIVTPGKYNKKVYLKKRKREKDRFMEKQNPFFSVNRGEKKWTKMNLFGLVHWMIQGKKDVRIRKELRSEAKQLI